jgi:hypothetical protein
MCQFFSFIDDGRRYLYADATKRRELLKSNPHTLEPDSHASVAVMFDVDEDKCDKYEYNPLTGVFGVDHLNRKRPRPESAEKWARELDFSSIVPELVLKPIVNSLEIKRGAPSPDEIKLLRQWGSVRDSVWDSLGASVWASVGDSVWTSVWNSVRDSVWDSVWNSVWKSVRDSVWDSVRAYAGSFFRLEKWADGCPCRCLADLWEAGLVPSFDGDTWRLHAGPNADVVYEE